MLDNGDYLNKVALGADGFNIPALVGLAAGGPYFHAGNARTLEELFDPAFRGHYAALGGADLSAREVTALVQYLLSLDESDESEPPPVQMAPFDPDLCGQFAQASP